MPKNGKKQPRIKSFMDTVVIYWSRSDQKWIAHSLRTDQIGIGECVIEALAEEMKAVRFSMELAEKDETIKLFRSAPQWVKDKVDNAQRLAEEAYERAYKLVYGRWPKSIEPLPDIKKNRRYVAKIKEEAPV